MNIELIHPKFSPFGEKFIEIDYFQVTKNQRKTKSNLSSADKHPESGPDQLCITESFAYIPFGVRFKVSDRNWELDTKLVEAPSPRTSGFRVGPT